jgi:hypothetical protein
MELYNKLNPKKKTSIKTQLVEKLLEQFGNKTFTRGDILRTLRVDVKGLTYNPTRDRGYYSCNIQTIKVRNYWTGARNEGYMMRPGREPRHLTKIGYNTYKVVS